MTTVSEFVKSADVLVAAREKAWQQKEKALKEKEKLQVQLEEWEQVQVILQEVALKTQEEIQYHICSIVNLALLGVFEEDYEFEVIFETKRSQTEASFQLRKGNVVVDPYKASGGGVVDIIAFALRISLWTLNTQRTRNTLVFDEPFRFVAADRQTKVAEMIHQISEKLNLQLIIVTHEKELKDCADALFQVRFEKGSSNVQRIDSET